MCYKSTTVDAKMRYEFATQKRRGGETGSYVEAFGATADASAFFS